MNFNKLKIFIFIFLLSSSILQAQMRSSMAYHGRRLKPDVAEFYIEEVSAKETSNGILMINFRFNLPLDPRSIEVSKVQGLLKDTENVQSSAIIFNKAGTVMRLTVPVRNAKNCDLCIKLEKVLSFNGIELSDLTFENVCDGYKFNSEDEYEDNEDKDKDQDEKDKKKNKRDD